MHINVQFLRRVVKFRWADLSTFIVSRATGSRLYDRQGERFYCDEVQLWGKFNCEKGIFFIIIYDNFNPLAFNISKKLELHFTSNFYLVTEIAAEILLAKEIVILSTFLLIKHNALYFRKFPEHASWWVHADQIRGPDNSARVLSTKLKCDCMIASGKGQARVRPILYMHMYVHF